ncbi:hypothetical protein FRC10_000933 [Ceratobasidium sp. 414]|nr:hypothetical protein FRC10_000933 [Ceratobasidium sp. 414]
MSYPGGVTFVVQAPATRVGIVVGPGGATINNIRRIYQVQIDVPSQKRSKHKKLVDPQLAKVGRGQAATVPIKISGNRDQAQDAANVVESLIASAHPPGLAEKHRAGKYAKRLEKRYGVRIVFGPSPKDQSRGESNSTALSSKVSTVSIEGPLAGVEQAWDELVEPSLVWVSKNAVGGIIGREGEMIESIQRETNTSIRIHTDEEWAPDRTTISLLGEPSAVAIATRRIQGIEAKINRETTGRMTIHPKYYRWGTCVTHLTTIDSETRHLIGPDGQALKAMILRAGGPIAPQAQARAVHL